MSPQDINEIISTMPKGIAKHQNDLEHLHSLNEGNAHVNMVGYDICILFLGHWIIVLDEMK